MHPRWLARLESLTARLRSRPTFAIATAVVGAWIASGSAQTPAPSTPQTTFRSGVDLVTIDVSVFDGDRRPVRGLTAADFTVREGGRVLPIVTFKAIDLPDKKAYPAQWMREIAPDVVANNMDAERVVVVLMDDINVATKPVDAMTARKLGHAIIDELGPEDLGAVVYTFSVEKSQEFTFDRVALHAAVDRFTSSKMPEGFGPGVRSMACPDNSCVTAAMRGVSDVLGKGWPGRRKTIALVSPQGRYQFGPQSIGGAADGLTMAGDSAAIWDSGPDLQRTFRALQEANVNIYQYDPRGIEDSLDIANSIGMFAGNTGGGIVTRTNAPEARVPEMFLENSSYYMLGFEPTGKPDTKFRPIDVDVSREDVDVRARSGYYHPQAAREKAPKAPPSTIDKAMAGALPTGDLPLTLTVAPFATPTPIGGGVAIIGGIDRSVALPDKDVVEIAARAFEMNRSDRRSRGVASGKMQLTRRPRANGIVQYDVATRLDLAPGRYEIRLAIDSPAARASGSAFFNVTIPDFRKEPLSVSGIVLGRLPLAPPPGKDPLNGLLPFVPTTMRTFSPTDRVGLMMRIYQGGKEPPVPVDVRTMLIDQMDKTLVDETTTLMTDVFQTTAGTSEHRLELPLRELPPGEYLIKVEAVLEKLTQTRHVRIRVE